MHFSLSHLIVFNSELKILGTSSVARAWSANFDSLFGGVIAAKMKEVFPMGGGFFAHYPDFLAVGLIVVITRKNIRFDVFFKVFSVA